MGCSGRLVHIFGKDILGEDYSKKQLTFRSSSYEEEISALGEVYARDYMKLLEAARRFDDKGMLVHILKGYDYLSQARVASYEKHKSDLKKLRMAIKKYCPHKYDAYFRVMAKDNYSGYVETLIPAERKSGERRMRTKRITRNLDNTKSILQEMPEHG